MSSFERVTAALRNHGCRVQATGANRARYTCPAHRDRRPSLSVTRKDDRTLVRCFAGCRTTDVVRVLGLTMGDLFDSSSSYADRSRIRPTIEATYDYGNGVEKVRLDPKGFRWRVRDGARWRYSLQNMQPGLYRAQALTGAAQIVIVEGEKAVDRLTTLGVRATCPPNGASSWQDEWTTVLAQSGCPQIAVLPDLDASGHRHAKRIAASCFANALAVKLVPLDGIPAGGDVVDYLATGRSLSDLVNAIEATPFWHPALDAERRRDARRHADRARSKRYRQRLRALQGAQPSGSADQHADQPEQHVFISLNPPEHARRPRMRTLPGTPKPQFAPLWTRPGVVWHAEAEWVRG
ncbi:MAG TPA: hypothetical protein VNJ02_14525 [Vicinamibacterales bacterium]|nr:hypothetical protein [Vicinamibacterales bacterium]